jgi:hypothetical protein
MTPDQPNSTTPPATAPATRAPASAEVPLALFAGRLLLGLNLVLAGFFAFVLVPMIPETRDFCSAWARPWPAISEAILNIPVTAYWANLGGLAAALVLLEALGRSRKVKLACNAAAMVLLVTAIMIVTVAFLRPLFMPIMKIDLVL